MKTTAIDQAHVYTDLAALQKLKSPGMERDQAISAVAKQFESMMVNLMMKSMRDANAVFAEGNMFHDSATEFYQEMLDHQLSLTMTRNKGMGLAEMLVKQLTQREQGIAPDALYDGLEDYPRNISSRTSPVGPEELEDDAGIALTEEEVMALGEVVYYAEQMTATATSPTGSDADEELSPADSSAVEFQSPRQFIETLLPAAEKVAAQLGVDPRVLLAQSALETGWGQHMIRDEGRHSFNLFGIKADERWTGEVVWTDTTEYRDGIAMKERAGFRAYESYEESFTDYLQFLQSNPRYEGALKVAHSPERYTQALQDAGYATDPMYATKINRIVQGQWMKDTSSEGTDL